MIKDTALQARLYRLYTTFFDKAEQERRWNPFRDVPWDKLKGREVDAELATVAETFCCVESYLPDYVAKGINIVRPYFGQTWFSANWGYEESKHSIALLEYLLRSGARSEEQMFDLQAQLMGKEWQLPFNTARQMTIYGCFQEMATFVIYVKQEQRAKEHGDEVLSTIFRLNARDEIAHCRFYEDVVKVLLEEDRQGTVRDIAHVAKNFSMPGVGIVPDYDERIKVMRDDGRVDRGVFLQKVFFPVLKYLDVTRQELQEAASNERAEKRQPNAAE
ncbi:MAG TPA: acyl-ACP desaturase [Polyangiaceae bacterium]|jgi:acyl-[acyl-carrier-protein] desaturase